MTLAVAYDSLSIVAVFGKQARDGAGLPAAALWGDLPRGRSAVAFLVATTGYLPVALLHRLDIVTTRRQRRPDRARRVLQFGRQHTAQGRPAIGDPLVLDLLGRPRISLRPWRMTAVKFLDHMRIIATPG